MDVSRHYTNVGTEAQSLKHWRIYTIRAKSYPPERVDYICTVSNYTVDEAAYALQRLPIIRALPRGTTLELVESDSDG